ncbi:hypothetical protein LRR80_01307 [Streptomyces sp. RO-S4]|uniref:hypothetical protein n=1 Tax=Streptomyces sp. RO-S4 TaxID=2902486 RepID=UPI00208DE3DD|nr:hypothetical protein [Streptomyces sp. RO-S4]MCO4695257.1 hypothetical protein [Streptomyces sp. RO-S4]
MSMIAGEPRRFGVAPSGARLTFETELHEPGPTPRRRLLVLDGEPAFQLSMWCGTCQFLFRRLEGADGTLSLDSVRERLAVGVSDLDEGILTAFGLLLPEGDYLPLLLRVVPRLVTPGQEGDYFSDEQVATWGPDQFWGLPEHPRTPYYRTFETVVNDEAHLYEFVVPMVPPLWNDQERVVEYVESMGRGTEPTAVAVSTLDRCEPAVSPHATDRYEHWGLTHFLLDGHHKLEAAAAARRPVRILSLLAMGESLSDCDDQRRLPALRERPHLTRGARPTR